MSFFILNHQYGLVLDDFLLCFWITEFSKSFWLIGCPLIKFGYTLMFQAVPPMNNSWIAGFGESTTAKDTKSTQDGNVVCEKEEATLLQYTFLSHLKSHSHLSPRYFLEEDRQVWSLPPLPLLHTILSHFKSPHYRDIERETKREKEWEREYMSYRISRNQLLKVLP